MWWIVAAQVTNNARDFSGTSIRVTLGSAIRLLAIIPPFGPVAGGTLVTIILAKPISSLQMSGLLACRFGETTTTGINRIRPATLLNATALTCATVIDRDSARCQHLLQANSLCHENRIPS